MSASSAGSRGDGEMTNQRKPSFGQRGPMLRSDGRVPVVDRVARPADLSSPPAVYRDGQAQISRFHDSPVERHWPKAGAVLAAGFAIVYSMSQGRTDPFGLVLVTVLFGGIAYFALNSFRKSLNNVHTVRTQLFRSPAFLVGGVAGLAYFVYATFINPTMVMGVEWGEQTAFQDGFQQADLGAAAILLLKAAGHIVAGGLLVEVIARRVFGARQAEGAEKNAR
jgi:hypothetical protein